MLVRISPKPVMPPTETGLRLQWHPLYLDVVDFCSFDLHRDTDDWPFLSLANFLLVPRRFGPRVPFIPSYIYENVRA